MRDDDKFYLIALFTVAAFAAYVGFMWGMIYAVQTERRHQTYSKSENPAPKTDMGEGSE